MFWTACQLLSVILFTACAAVISVSYMLDTFQPVFGWQVAWGFAGAALAMEITKPLAVRAAFGAQGWRGMLPGAIGAVLCVGISTYIEFQFVAKGRDVHAQKAAVTDARRGVIDERAQRWQGELEQLGHTRTAAEVAPLVQAAEKAAGDCSKILTVAQREACKSLPALRSEAARAVRKAEIEAKIAALEVRSDAVETGTPEAQAVAAILGVVGVSVPLVQVDRLMGPALIILLQMVSVVAAALGPREAPSGSAGTSAHGSPEKYPDISTGSPRTTSGSERVPEVGDANHEPDQSARARFMAVLDACGGELHEGSRAMCNRVGLSRRMLDKVLAQLVSEGLLTVTKTTTGTKVQRV